jgi:hypothetical protein
MDDTIKEFYIKVLTTAINQEFPNNENDITLAPLHIYDELIQMKCLRGKPVKHFGSSHHYENLEITGYGRQLLQELITETQKEMAKKTKPIRTFVKNNWIILLPVLIAFIGILVTIFIHFYPKTK